VNGKKAKQIRRQVKLITKLAHGTKEMERHIYKKAKRDFR